MFYRCQVTHPDLLLDQLSGVIDLLWRPAHGEHLYVGVSVGRRVPLQLYSGTRLLAYAFNRLSSCRQAEEK